MAANNNVILVAYSDDIFATAARHIIAHSNKLPDLCNTVVLLPDLQFAPQLRKQLLQAARTNHSALLGPVISTIDQWLSEQHPLDVHIPARARRELMLVEVIQQHPNLFKGANAWQISSSLISLFDELTLNRVNIPDKLDAFIERLQAAYGISDSQPQPLGMEASIIHRLWQAWHAQLNDAQQLDPGVACLQRLARQQSQDKQPVFYFIGFESLPAAQTEWLASLLQDGHAVSIHYQRCAAVGIDDRSPLQHLLSECKPPDSQNQYSTCLNAVFQKDNTPLAARAKACAADYPESPLRNQLSILSGASPELEARAIDIQVRRWLLEGKQNIAIVSEDRRLARRVRALLDRAGITLEDTGGWALSTTSAAAVLERWLETVEEDFAHQPLLDVLKSPFLFPEADKEAHTHTVYRLEQDIIQRENIASGLQRYKNNIDLRLARHNTQFTRATAEELHTLLNTLDEAAAPLRPCLGETRTHPTRLLNALRDSLEQLGVWPAYEQDLAGQQILREWQLLVDAARDSGLDMNWVEFRAWLGAALEQHDFKPATENSPVSLLTLQQAQLGQFDAVIIGACDREHLPVRQSASPFFNDPVRRDLGLPIWQQHYQVQLQFFRRLLEASPAVVLSWHRENNGEHRMPSPWLEAIRNFHRLGWQHDLENQTLVSLLLQPAARVAGSNTLPTPQALPFPRQSLPAKLLPAELSVSMHRHLIDCPYKFFAACGLQLKPRDDVRETFEKAEYGSLVHQILEIFHQGKTGYPAAFKAPVTSANREQAIDALDTISSAVFGKRLEDNFEHRAWQRRWSQLIPDYIDWQIRQQQEWTFSQAEQTGAVELIPGRSLVGRLDRIDQQGETRLVIDYKTGSIPKQPDVDSGEEVQLPSYALLTATLPQSVEHLQLDGKVKVGSRLDGDQLEDIANRVKTRLVTLLQEIECGEPLPAWGDVNTCRYCEMSGLCRQQAWSE